MSPRNRSSFLATSTTARRTVTYPAILNYEIFRFWSPTPAPLSAGTRVSRGEWRRASCRSQCAAALSRCFQELSPLPLRRCWLYIPNTDCCCLPPEVGSFTHVGYCKLIDHNCCSLIWVFTCSGGVRFCSVLLPVFISLTNIRPHLSLCFSYIISS